MIQIRYANSFLTPTADVLSDHINPTMPQLLGDGHPRRRVPVPVGDLPASAGRGVARQRLVPIACVGGPQVMQPPARVLLDDLAGVAQLALAPACP